MSNSPDDILLRSPSSSPPLPRRASPLGGKTCPIGHSTTPHIPNHPLPPMPVLQLSTIQKKRISKDSSVIVQFTDSDQYVPDLDDVSNRPVLHKPTNISI